MATSGRLQPGRLHERHPGIAQGQAASFKEVVGVCLSRHHESPPTTCRVSLGSSAIDYPMDWDKPTARDRATYANEEDATCEAAYAVALAAAEVHLNLVAFRRSESRSGCDYYLGPAEECTDDLDFDAEISEMVRLEVSGIDRDDQVKMLTRAKAKVEQIRAAQRPGDGMAAIVGFRSPAVLFRRS